ncbi:molybdopterin oxidoreductase [Denitrovibrio acetiphilus DSM 12809]|uniref:trimethylamine-N-oxide reductase n=1 Tax=Denitrovibrio acetiphilus (strain DSM 12809 / NBRC 114555 / N2460) TaxID=522772 RepID=D4H2E6_DENA2|nr:molybdopterin-dependent oxidoreductase [Denitrovibrio acetiphilus]ADD68937.1 molybdopterin oxidoreductase [Denitrovibrio acetiphilus DSM 12809]
MLLNRRQFIRMAAATFAAIAYSPEVLASEGDRVITHATHMGPLKAYVRNGKIVKIEAMGMDMDPVDLLYALKDVTYSPNRIKHPCVRKSYLDGSDKRHLRGAEEFVRVSWDEALDLVAESLIKTREEYGNESIFKTTYARWSHPGRIHQASSLQARMLGLFGGFTDIVGDYSAGAATRILPYVVGDMEVYSRQTARDVVLENTELILMWGTDPFKTEKVDYHVPIHSDFEWFRAMRDKGVKFVTIDPLKSKTCRELGSEWVPIRAASDVPMILAMCYTLYIEGLYNKEFIEKYTVGFYTFLKYLTGEKDGVVKDAAWAEKICGVPADKIKELARMSVKHRTLVTGSWACQRIQNGEQFHWSLVALGSMIGQIGLPGGGLYLNMAYCTAGAPYSGAGIPIMVSQGGNPVQTLIPASRMAELLLNPGKTIEYNGKRLTYPNIKLIYSAGVTPIGHQPDVNKLIKGVRKADTVITHEPWWTPTAKYSDIVLPATTSFERNDLTFGSSYGVEYVFAMKQIISPLFEARNDYDIFRDLSAKFGFEKEFTKGRSIDEWIEWSYSKVRAEVSFADFWDKGYVHFPPLKGSRDFVRHADFRNDPVKKHLRTPSGKIELFSEKIASFGYRDCPGHPAWIEPSEGIGSYLSRKYPFQLISPHPEHRLHSQLDNSDLSKKYKISGREPIHINTEDASRMGLKEGDLVEVYNNRGKVIAGTHVSDGIIKGVVAIEEGAWFAAEDPADSNSRCISGQVNVLTSDRPTSRLAQAISANSCLVAIRCCGKIKSESFSQINYCQIH